MTWRPYAEWFGLKGYDAQRLEQLHRANGDPVPLHERRAVAKVVACRLRAALDCEAMDYVKGSGYCLTEIGLAECDRAVRECAA